MPTKYLALRSLSAVVELNLLLDFWVQAQGNRTGPSGILKHGPVLWRQGRRQRELHIDLADASWVSQHVFCYVEGRTG